MEHRQHRWQLIQLDAEAPGHPCPECSARVDLRSSQVFARHAYVKKHPRVQVLCPECDQVFPAQYPDSSVDCPWCRLRFDPHSGPAKRGQARCQVCGADFSISKTARAAEKPPAHRLYAKLVLRPDGTREYLPATAADRHAYKLAIRRLRSMKPRRPEVPIEDGYNTRQVLSYGYSSWDQMFNDRQHLALAILAQGIRKLEPCAERHALMLLFSGVLEFNNMFASYKGEGTGAARHMFSHHVLEPERTPLEANLWGTPKSSGSFSTLFRSPLLRAMARSPIDLDVLLTCRKHKPGETGCRTNGEILAAAIRNAEKQTAHFNRMGRKLSENDVRVILHSQLLVELSRAGNESSTLLDLLLETSEPVIELWNAQRRR